MRITGRLRPIAAVTAVVVAAVFAVSNAAYADPVPVDAQQLRDQLFVASVRLHTSGSQGLKDLVLSAEMLGYRQRYPDKSVADIHNHAAVMSQWYDGHLQGTDFALQTYEALPHVLNMLALSPEAAIAAPVMKELLDVVVSPVGKAYGDRINQVTTAQFSYDQFQRWYPVQDLIWNRITGRAATDSTFAAAWDGDFGARLGVMSTASLDQLAADPVIGTYMNVGALLDHQMNTDAYIAEAKAQILSAVQHIETQNEQLITSAHDISATYPAVSTGNRPTTPTPFNDAKAAAAARQQVIDGFGVGIEVLAKALGFVDAKSSRIAAGVGKAAVQIATAINKYIPSIAGFSLGQALTSMSTVALTGNIVGAIGALLPVFLDGPTPDQMLMNEIHKLRDQVTQLSNTMNSRFDRVDHALTVMYASMLDRFDQVVALQHATLGQLADISADLYHMNTSIDNWGEAIMAALRAGGLNPVMGAINDGVGHQDTYGEPIPTYTEYQKYEGPLNLMAATTAKSDPYAGPNPTSYKNLDPRSVLTTYGAKGAINYLDWYAGQNYGTSPVVLPDTVADAVPWTVAARGYARLVAENPGYAARVNQNRTIEILGAGQGIIDRSTRFSIPLSTPDSAGRRTNVLYTNIMNDYKNAMRAYSTELGNIRGANPGGKTFNVFGNGDQQIDASLRMTDTAKIGPCAGTPGQPTITRPSTASITQTPDTLYLAKYAHPDQPTIKLCYSASFANVEEFDDVKWHHTYADMNIVVRILVHWGNQDRDYRSWSMTWNLGETCRQYLTGAPGGFCNNITYYLNKWDSTYLTGFTNSALMQTDWNVPLTARDRMNEYLTGLQKAYYDKVVAALNDPHSALFATNERLSRIVALVQAYTQLGFAKALSQDEMLGLLTDGAERLPVDLDGRNMLGDSFRQAQANYAGCATTGPGGACAPGTPIVNPRANQYTIPLQCDGTPPGYTGDPVGDCLLGIANLRADVLSTRFDQHSLELATGVYTEGMPDVLAIMEDLTLADAFVRHA
ncbi:hypothetical protein [Hamadaea tsunoensis]|uniref:hypothetical protein n=1 Tax=Hamadaea tsunoensis TaxID=53368 RepID=UPI0012FCF16D|nr:hypothetical protein [Hamadaea tsunoensis]